MQFSKKFEKCFVLQTSSRYYLTTLACIHSIRKYSNIPIVVYTMDSDLKFDIDGVISVFWKTDMNISTNDEMYITHSGSDENTLGINDDVKNFYILRKEKTIYNILIQRPLFVKHCLENFSELIAYIDSDSVATPHIDYIFEMFDKNSVYPYFTKGVYSFLEYYGRGRIRDIYDIEKCLEVDICRLFDVDLSNRTFYRQTGYFVAGQFCTPFLDEWYSWCTHPEVYENTEKYAPYHEETVVNALLWKLKFTKSLPLIYVNVSDDIVNSVYKTIRFRDEEYHVRSWFKIPTCSNHLLFFHGEKRPDMMYKLSQDIDLLTSSDVYVLHVFKTHTQFLSFNNLLTEKNHTPIIYYDEASLKSYISEYDFDIVHFHFEIEKCLNHDLIQLLLSNDRLYRVVEDIETDNTEYMMEKEIITDAIFSKTHLNYPILNGFNEDTLDIFYKKLKEKSITKHYMNKKTKPTVNLSFNNGYVCEILSNDTSDDYDYNVSFIDVDKSLPIYGTTLKVNCWAAPNIKFYRNIRIEVTSNNPYFEKFTYDVNLKGKKVLIKFESSSLGDNIAWFPYVKEFKNKYECDVYCMCPLDFIFDKDYYTDITFVKEYNSSDYFAIYDIGWFKTENNFIDLSKNPRTYVDQPLQKTASDILNLPFSEVRPKLKYAECTLDLPEKFFTFSVQSTAQSKYWNFNNGWEILLNILNRHGYVGICIDKHPTFGVGAHMNKIPNNCINLSQLDLTDAMGVINKSSFHIGLSSGLSWLAWAVGKQVVLISGFTDPICEFKENCIRVHNNSVCNGCFTNPQFKFDPSDWMWCPVHKGTDRQFECTKKITPFDVYSQILMNNLI